MHIDAALAHHIEAADAALVRDVGRHVGTVLPIGNGAAAFCGLRHPATKAVGILGGAHWVDDFEVAEAYFRERGTSLKVEVSTLADPAVVSTLSRRGYQLTGFANVLGLPLGGPIAEPTVEVRRPHDDELPSFVEVMARGFAHPDTDGKPALDLSEGMFEVARDYLKAPSIERWVALVDGVIAAGGNARLDPSGILQLCGAATVPELRRRGAQGSLLAARLRDGTARGAKLAVITTVPGSASEDNARKLGFQLLYVKAILIG